MVTACGGKEKIKMCIRDSNTIEVMRRDTLEKETITCDGIEEYVKNLLEDVDRKAAFSMNPFFLIIDNDIPLSKVAK